MASRQEVVAARPYQHFYHRTKRNADGTAVRCRANGACKTWKTRPDDFRLPVKYGLKTCFYITPHNANEWLVDEPMYRERRTTACADGKAS